MTHTKEHCSKYFCCDLSRRPRIEVQILNDFFNEFPQFVAFEAFKAANFPPLSFPEEFKKA
jgi:hypothetical protein